jgi:hypothetical protein
MLHGIISPVGINEAHSRQNQPENLEQNKPIFKRATSEGSKRPPIETINLKHGRKYTSQLLPTNLNPGFQRDVEASLTSTELNADRPSSERENLPEKTPRHLKRKERHRLVEQERPCDLGKRIRNETKLPDDAFDSLGENVSISENPSPLIKEHSVTHFNLEMPDGYVPEEPERNIEGLQKFNKLDPYVLIDPGKKGDTVIQMGARYDIKRKGIPEDHVFVFNGSKEPTRMKCQVQELKNVRSNQLSGLTSRSRLDLMGHGNSKSFSGILDMSDPMELAQILWKAGLREVGVIKFQSCNIGEGKFLEKFREHLDTLGIKVGWISGPKYYLCYLRSEVKIGDKIIGFKPLPLPTKWIGPAPAKYNLKVIKGNIDVSVEGTRYYIKPGAKNKSDKNSVEIMEKKVGNPCFQKIEQKPAAKLVLNEDSEIENSGNGKIEDSTGVPQETSSRHE